MSDTFRFGAGPAPEVLSYLDGRGLSASFSWKDHYGEEHAHAFTVAKAMQVEVLTTIHNEVQKAIRDGLPYESFKKSLTPKLKALGWWGQQDMTDPRTGVTEPVQLGSPRRLKTIYWANTRTAYGAGKWARYQRTKAALPYLVYRLGASAEHRPHHEAKENTILPIDDPFWDTWFPPNGWGCKCWTRQITEAEAESLGGVSERPDVPTKTWVNDRTGETRDIPVGIDAGWDSNAGKTRGRDLARHLAGKLNAAPDGVRRAAIHDMVTSQVFRRVQNGDLDGRKVFAPAAALPDDLAGILPAKTRVAFLSSETAAKQIKKRHGADGLTLAPEDYKKVQELLDTGMILEERPAHFAAMGYVDGVGWLAAFKITQKMDEIFLVSFRRTNKKEMVERPKKAQKILRGE